MSSWHTVYPKKYAHGFVVLCFVVVMQSFIMNSHEVFIHIHQGCFAGTGAIVRLPQCQWSKPDGYGKISQCITTTKHSKAKTVCIFLGIYCRNTFSTISRLCVCVGGGGGGLKYLVNWDAETLIWRHCDGYQRGFWVIWSRLKTNWLNVIWSLQTVTIFACEYLIALGEKIWIQLVWHSVSN